MFVALSRIAEGSLGAAGSQLWEELKGLVSRRNKSAGRDLEATVPDETAGANVELLARALAQNAANDPELRSSLEDWMGRVQQQIDGDVSNSITGAVHGNVVQARDIGSLRID